MTNEDTGVYFQLYIGGAKKGVDFIAPSPKTVALFRDEVKKRRSNALSLVDAGDLEVYPAGTTFPIPAGIDPLTVGANLPPASEENSPLVVVAPASSQTQIAGKHPRNGEIMQEPAPKKIRALMDIEIKTNTSVKLAIDCEEILNPRRVKTIHYYGRLGLSEIFATLCDDQAGQQHFNISLIGPPGAGKSNLVFAAAEHIAHKKKQNVLWVARRFSQSQWKVKLFSASADNQTTGHLLKLDTTETSLAKILQSPLAKDAKVLVLDALTQADTDTGQAGADAFQWAGRDDRVGGRRVIHVSSLGTFSAKQTIRDSVNLKEVFMPLFTRNDYIESLSDPELKKQLCETLQINDPDSASVEDVVDQKFFYSGINARWFYNRSITEIKEECVDIIDRLDKNVSSTGSKDPRAVNSAVATVKGGGRLIKVYTSCFLAQSIGSMA